MSYQSRHASTYALEYTSRYGIIVYLESKIFILFNDFYFVKYLTIKNVLINQSIKWRTVKVEKKTRLTNLDMYLLMRYNI